MKTSRPKRMALAAVLAGALIAPLSACSVTSNAQSSATGESALLQTIKSRGKIVIGSSNDAPFSYIDVKTKEVKGLDIDILRAVNKRMGVNDVELKVISFDNLLIELNNNNIDMVVDAMYVKDARLQQAAFSDKWYKEGEAIVLPKDSTIASKADLKDKTIGAQPNTAFYDTAQAWKDAGLVKNVLSFDNQANLMTAVNLGKVDAVITDGIVANYTLAQDTSLNLKLLSGYTPEASGQIGSAVRFSDEAYLTEFNKELNAMKEDGSLLKILQSYGLNEDYFVGVDAGKTTNVK
jgi:polar amino acid transport system substrate-binding protein